MTWEELEAKHAKEWEDFNVSRDTEYRDLEERYRELEEVFFDTGDGMPLKIEERRRLEYEGWNSKWEYPAGKMAGTLKSQQKKETEEWLKLEKMQDRENYLRKLESHQNQDMTSNHRKDKEQGR